MNQYIFILGNNHALSAAEIMTTYPDLQIISHHNNILIGEIKDLDCERAMSVLGGTIKIGQVIARGIESQPIIDELTSGNTDAKIKYGLSFYGVKPSKIGMEIKKELKGLGLSCRLVTSKEKSLSAVIIKKERVQDFIVLPNMMAATRSVQDFEGYGKRDYDRPKSDAHSGMLPPKLARMMINLTGIKTNQTLLDPFCGSGTVLMEAATVGIGNIIGSDLSDKAVSDSKINLDWLVDTDKLENINTKVYSLDVKKISDKIAAESIDAIATEPYLGPPIKGSENEQQIRQIIAELEGLYLKAFNEFSKILKPGGRIVIVRPSWHMDKTYDINIDKQIEQLGFRKQNTDELVYKREGQKVWRYIEIWQIKK
jgi:tRNA G10  N-methylase Trm11